MIIGHEAQLNFLKKSWENGRLAQAYVFAGADGVGKRRVARELAGWILGRAVPEDLSKDFGLLYLERTINAKTGKKHKDIVIEETQKVREYLGHHSFAGDYKVVIINEAEFLNEKAGNALLKTLEEPSPRSVIILLANDEKKLLPTMLSRCQPVRFYPVPTRKIYDALLARGVDRDMALELSRLAHHRPGRAIEMLSEPEKQEFYTAETERFFKLHKGDLAARFRELNDLFGKDDDHGDHIETRENLINVLHLWLGLWRDFILAKNQTEELIGNVAYQDKIRTVSPRYTSRQISHLISATEEAVDLLRQNIHPRLLIENIILSF